MVAHPRCRPRRFRARRSAQRAYRPELAARARVAGAETHTGTDRCLLPWRFHYAPLGCGRAEIPGAARELESELHGLERRKFRLGRRQDAEHSVAPAAG